MRVYESDNGDFCEEDGVKPASWKDSPWSILDSVDDQLKKFKLEVVYNDGGGGVCWKIEKRIKEKKTVKTRVGKPSV